MYRVSVLYTHPGAMCFYIFDALFCIAHTDNRCTHASCTCVLERVLCRMYTFSHAACTQWSSRTYTHTHTESREFYMHCSTTWSLCMHTNNSWYACASHVHIELHTLHVLHWSACTGIRLHAHIRDLDMYVRIYVHMYICINVYTDTHFYTYAYTHIYIYAYLHKHTGIYTGRDVNKDGHMHICKHIYLHILATCEYMC